MNMYKLFIIFFGIGLFMTVYAIIMSNFIETFHVLNLLYFGIGSALMGSGIGLGVGHLFYRKETGGNNDD